MNTPRALQHDFFKVVPTTEQVPEMLRPANGKKNLSVGFPGMPK